MLMCSKIKITHTHTHTCMHIFYYHFILNEEERTTYCSVIAEQCIAFVPPFKVKQATTTATTD